MVGQTRQDQTVSTSPARHLDHLIDIQDTGDFTAVPNELMRAFFDGYVPVAKFKLICMMLSHSSRFKIKRSYLNNRFSQTSLKKYLDEIVAEGFVRREKLSCQTGGFQWVYHTNRTSEWQIPTEKCRAAPEEDHFDDALTEEYRPIRDALIGKPSLREPLKETNPNQKNLNSLSLYARDHDILTHEKMASILLDKLRELGTRGDPKLMAKTLALVNQNLGWSWTTIEERLDELSLYAAAREASSHGDCSSRIWQAARYWRDVSQKSDVSISKFTGYARPAKAESNYKKAPIATVTAPPWVCTKDMFDEWLIKADESAMKRVGKISGVSREERLTYFDIVSEDDFKQVGFSREEFFRLHFPEQA